MRGLGEDIENYVLELICWLKSEEMIIELKIVSDVYIAVLQARNAGIA